MNYPSSYDCSFDFKKEFVDSGDWAKLSRCLYVLLSQLYDDGILNLKPSEVVSEYKDVGWTTKLVTSIKLGDDTTD